MSNITFRDDIVGLRALAIIPIILFHFDYVLFKGGFIGVDIFFVISGYLITSIIFTNIKNFSFKDFIERRARRIIPLLLIVIIFTIPFSYFFMLPRNLFDFGQSVFLSPIFLSNFLFWFEEGYWELSSQMKPLLHTWSLSVEWQFYIFFPLIFLLKKKEYIILSFFIFWIISFIIAINQESEYLTITTDKILSIGNFYLPFSRFWEFITGGLIFFFEKNILFKKKIINNILSLIGILLVLWSIYYLDENLIYPNSFSLIPIIGISLIIVYIQKNSLIYNLITSKATKHIGEISYSLYLWHFPVIVFEKYLTNLNPNFLTNLGTLLIVYIFSLVSYKYVERPFFKKKILTSKSFFILSSSLVTIICLIGHLITISDAKTSFMNKKIENIKKKTNLYNLYFSNTITYNEPLPTMYQNHLAIKKVLIIGDSHGRDLARTLIEYSNIKFKKKEIRDFEFIFTEINNLKIINDSIIEKKINESDIVVLSRQFTSENNQIKNIKFLSQYIKNKNKKFILVGSAPEFYTAEDDLLLTFVLQNDENIQSLENKDFKKTNKFFYNNLKTYLLNTNKRLKKISIDSSFIFVDRFDFTCELNKKLCFGLDYNGKKNFTDYSHFSKTGIMFFAEKIYELDWVNKNFN